MSINDAYYNNRNVDYNGNNLTVDVGTFTINGDLSVTGSIIGSEDSSVDLNTNTTLYITGNDDWYFDNDDKNFFIFNDQYKKISMGYDVENVSMIYSATQRDNPMFSFSGETDWNNYGSGTGNRYLARFQNYANTPGSSGLDIVLNRTDNDISNANIFLNFSGFTGSTFDNSGYIAGLYNDEGLGIYSGNKIRIDAGNGVTINSSSLFVDVDGSASPTQIRFQDTSGDSGHTLSKFVFANKTIENTDIFIEFRDQSGSVGSIRGGDFNNAFIGKDDSSGTVTEFAAYGNTGGSQNIRGNLNTGARGVSYYSFGSDFGEYFYYHDESQFLEEVVEGNVVYVKGDEFFKENIKGSFPMIVTKRAAFIGNDKDDDRKKEVLSFIGQVYVLIEGKCKPGDYIIPSGNYCYAIDSENISFSEYKKSLGRCLFEKQSENIGHVKCAICLK